MDTADLRTHALTVLTAANPTTPIPTGHSLLRVQLAAQVRADTGCGLREVVQAVDWAIGQANTAGSIDQYGQPAGSGWRYDFPNGQVATVAADHQQRFRFELHVGDPTTTGVESTHPGLTTLEVETKLHAIAAL